MVTSSAVVGSSAINSRGSQASAIAIMTRCRIPPKADAGTLQRGVPVPGSCTSLSISIALRIASSRERPAVKDQHFGDLTADGQHRIERRHRFPGRSWKWHRREPSASPAPTIEQIASFEHDAPRPFVRVAMRSGAESKAM